MRSIEPRNLEIPRCAIAHLRSGPSDHPGMTKNGLLRRFRLRSLSYGGQVAARNDGRPTVGCLKMASIEGPVSRQRRCAPSPLVGRDERSSLLEGWGEGFRSIDRA